MHFYPPIKAILEDAIRREKEAKTAKKKTTTLDRGEIEFSEGRYICVCASLAS